MPEGHHPPVDIPPADGVTWDFPPSSTEPADIDAKGTDRRVWIAVAAVAIVVLFGGLMAMIVSIGSDTDSLAGDEEAETTIDEREADGEDLFGADEDDTQDSPEEEAETPEEPADPPPGLELNFRPDSVAVTDDAVWVSDFNCGVVAKVDKVSEEVLQAVTGGGSASGVAVADGSVWVGNRLGGIVTRFDPETARPQGQVEFEGFALGLAEGDGSVWAVDPATEAVHRIDPETNEVVATIEVGQRPHYAVVDDGVVWVTNNLDGTVTQIDATTNTVISEIEVGVGAIHVVAGAGSIWVTNADDATVARLDPASGELTDIIEVGARPHALEFASDTLWVGTELGQLWRIDPTTNESEQIPDMDFNSIDMTVDGTNVWVADSENGEVIGFDSVTGDVFFRADLSEFGGCEAFRDRATTPAV